MVYEMDMEETPLPEEGPIAEPDATEMTEPDEDVAEDEERDDRD